MNIKEKILAYIIKKDIRWDDFCANTSVSQSNFKGKAKGSELGSNKLASILAAYSDLSAEWLLRGEGSMLRKDEPQPQIIDSNIAANVAGNDIQISVDRTLLGELAAQRKQTDRALALLEKLLNKQ